MGNDKELYPKSKFMMCITRLEKIETQLGDNESKTFQYVVKSSNWEKGNGKEFRESIYKDRESGIKRSIEIVNEKPEKFVINQIYMLPTRDRVWIWIES